MKYSTIGALTAIVAVIALGLGFRAGTDARLPTEAAGTLASGKASVEKIVHDYLIANPEVLAEAQTALEAKQQQARKAQESKVIAANEQQILHSPDDAVFGNPKGDVTIVEFYDYNCPYCKHALTDMDSLLAGDPNLRFVLKEFPILGQDSVHAHIVAEAFRQLMPAKYEEFHHRLLGSKSRANEQSAIALAVSMGADETALRQAMKSPKIMQIFKDNYALANKLNITGTPSYVVGDELVFGAIGLDTLVQKVANMRKCHHASC
jgi:protein-disulfide isomerase